MERLVHFRCGACQGWWSIGDAPLDRTTWYCPWCGTRLAVGHSAAVTTPSTKRATYHEQTPPSP